MRRVRRAASAAALAFALALFGCEKIDRNMWDSPAFKPQSDPVRLPPEASVPTKGRERIPAPGEAAALKNPVASEEGAVARGKELYGIFCVPCHGESGAGDGPVGRKFVPTPADLRAGGPFARLPDGSLFLIITSGLGGMPPFRADLDPRERWMIVSYLRTLK